MSTPNRRLLALAEARGLIREHEIRCDELVAFEVSRGTSPWERQRRIALDQCRQMMAFWSIHPRDLRGVDAVALQPLPPKYRHPVEGHIWDGEGLQPDWLKRALTKEGYTVRELRVEPEHSTS